MDCYHYYNPDTGEYRGSAVATLAVPGALPPRNAVLFGPEKREGFHPVLTPERDAWTLVEDHRGSEGWVNGERLKIARLGPLPDGWSELPPPPPDLRSNAEKRRDAYRAEADSHRDAALGYRVEAEAWRSAGEAAKAAEAEEWAAEALALYLAKKEEIRRRFPDGEDDE